MRVILRRTLAGAAFGAAVLLYPARASADPIVITGGALDVEVQLSGIRLIDLSGDGLALQAGMEGVFTSDLRSCFPCDGVPPVVTLGGSFTGADSGGGVPMTVDHRTYPQLWIDFAGGSISTSSVQLSGLGPSTVNVPFTMQAVIRGYLVDPFVETTDPIFTRELQGSGIASVPFVGVQGDGRILHSVASPARYTFGAAAPVPEPATWLLVTAGGLAWSAGRRRRRSRRGLPEA